MPSIKHSIARRKTMNRRNSLALGLALVAASALWPFSANAQPYPTRPIRVVVPFPPSGVMDIVGRMWAQRVTPHLGTIVIENRPGAGGTIGAGEVVRAQPDGYTLLIGNTSTQVLNPAVMKKPPYDPAKDFVTVDIVAVSTTAIMAHPSLPARNLKDLIAYAKANPGKLSYGSAGAGTLTHLAGEMFNQRTGLHILHVPYKGVGPASTDLVSGYIPLLVANVTGHFLGLREAGKLRILAVNGSERLNALPDVPTSNETVKNMVAQLFVGVFAPAGTPKTIVDQVSQATRKALAEASFQKLLNNSGVEPVLDSSPEKAQRFVDQEQERLLPLIKSSGLKQ
jgi:tripartite-type tricarboxylate transporter receptor subunit TctC